MNFLPCEFIDIHIYKYSFNYNFWVEGKGHVWGTEDVW